MLSDEQKAQLNDAISQYAQAIRLDRMEAGGWRLEIHDLVESFLDPLRPRDPKVELPPEGRVVLLSIPDDLDGWMVVTGSLGRGWRPDGVEAPLVWSLDKREHRRDLVRYWWPSQVPPKDPKE